MPGDKQGKLSEDWSGARGLAEDVRRYGAWMREQAQQRIGHLYPQVEVTAEMVAERADLTPLLGQKLTVIAWLWARHFPRLLCCRAKWASKPMWNPWWTAIATASRCGWARRLMVPRAALRLANEQHSFAFYRSRLLTTTTFAPKAKRVVWGNG